MPLNFFLIIMKVVSKTHLGNNRWSGDDELKMKAMVAADFFGVIEPRLCGGFTVDEYQNRFSGVVSSCVGDGFAARFAWHSNEFL